MLLSLVVIVLLLIIPTINQLFITIRTVFHLKAGGNREIVPVLGVAVALP